MPYAPTYVSKHLIKKELYRLTRSTIGSGSACNIRFQGRSVMLFMVSSW